MNDYEKLNLLVEKSKAWLNAFYKDENNEFVKKGLEICEFKGNKSQKIAILRRIVDLKVDPLLSEFKKLGYTKRKCDRLREEMYEFTRMIHEDLHRNLINDIGKAQILEEFYFQLIVGVHKIGLVINEFQKEWQKKIIDTINRRFAVKFKNIADARKFILENKLYQKTPRDEICDRSYGVIVEKDNTFEFVPYAVGFKSQILRLEQAFDIVLKSLKQTQNRLEHTAYIEYLTKLKEAFLQTDNDKVIGAWRDAEIAWMDIKTPIQIGHPLEYYEDAYTHAVALEWDIRLARASKFDVDKFKTQTKETFDKIYKKIAVNNQIMHSLVNSNIDKTQLYISTPMIYYGADLNGLFSAQVVPNDEFVSSNCGKKIFAFVDFVYENAKAKPFMKLTSEIFDKTYLNFGRSILFKHPEIWRRVYEISTIGHEFGHIFFIDEDTENLMNKSGVFKYIEEYKATTGGLMNFFLHEEDSLKMAVLDELIRRSVGLIAWQKVDEVKAYYCESLIHLSVLFDSGVLNFVEQKLLLNFSKESYENFKKKCIANYEKLAKIYADKVDASGFLNQFAQVKNGVYLPKDKKVREFVEFYHKRYEEIGNEVDESGEREKWI